MPTLITHAKPSGPHCQQALAQLQLPHLSALLALLTAGQRLQRDADTLSPLHEVLQAQALGLATTDGLLPWAALQAQALQLPSAAPGQGWAWLSLCHWQVNADHVRMADPLDSQISADESQQVMEAMRGFFAEDGISLHGLHQGHWLALGAVFLELPTASLARASGGAVDHWLPRQAQAQPLRRLQNEMQMLLYNHPVNDARSARGLLPVNSFWVSGTGSLPAGYQVPAASAAASSNTVLSDLQEATRSDDATAWVQAWQALDRGPLHALLALAQSGQPVDLTLCGEDAAQSFSLQPRSVWTRLQQLAGRSHTDVPTLLQSL